MLIAKRRIASADSGCNNGLSKILLMPVALGCRRGAEILPMFPALASMALVASIRLCIEIRIWISVVFSLAVVERSDSWQQHLRDFEQHG